MFPDKNPSNSKHTQIHSFVFLFAEGFDIIAGVRKNEPLESGTRNLVYLQWLDEQYAGWGEPMPFSMSHTLAQTKDSNKLCKRSERLLVRIPPHSQKTQSEKAIPALAKHASNKQDTTIGYGRGKTVLLPHPRHIMGMTRLASHFTYFYEPHTQL
jgi:hypothetical protein